MKNIFLKWTIFWIGFCFTILAFIIWYAAWTNIATKSDGQTLNALSWNELVNNINTIGAKVDTLSNIPAWFIWAFNLSSCPSGWIAADGNNGTPNLRGEFIRGWDYNNSGVDNGRLLGSWQKPSIVSHDWNNNNRVAGIILDSVSNIENVWQENPVNNWYSSSPAWTTLELISGWSNVGALLNGNAHGWVTRPRNVALLYCMKQ